MDVENELKSIEQMIKKSDYETEVLEKFVKNSKKFVFLEIFLKKENISFNQLENIAKIFVEYNVTPLLVSDLGMDFDLKNKIVIKDNYIDF